MLDELVPFVFVQPFLLQIDWIDFGEVEIRSLGSYQLPLLIPVLLPVVLPVGVQNQVSVSRERQSLRLDLDGDSQRNQYVHPMTSKLVAVRCSCWKPVQYPV